MYKFRQILVAALLGILMYGPAHATTALPLNLDEIVGSAETAFQGICTDNRSERDPQTGLIVTYTTFTVTEVIKGTLGAMHTIKQVGGTTGGETYRIMGVPGFAVGQDYVVFLYGISNAGFSSPVGLAQGKFTVIPGPNGPEVSNGRDFKEMIQPQAGITVPQTAAIKLQKTPGELKQMQLNEFKQIVRQHAGTKK